MQCQGKTLAGRRCKNPATMTGYCWRHRDQKPVAITFPPAPLGNAITFPPDVIREIARKMSIKDILTQCLVSKQFNNAICSNLTFWQQLAQERELELPDVPELTIDSLPLHALKKYLYEKEHIPKVYFELRTMHFIPPHKRLYGFDTSYEVEPFDDLEREQSMPLAPLGPTKAIPLADFIEYIRDQYDCYHDGVDRIDPEELDAILTPDNFNAKLDKIHRNLKEFDVLDFGFANDEQPNDLFFVFRHGDDHGHDRHELMVKSIEARYTAYEFTLFIPLEGFSMLTEVYNRGTVVTGPSGARNKQPLTQRMVRKLYAVDGKGVVDEDGNLRLIGDEDDPVVVIRGVPMHITEDFID